MYTPHGGYKYICIIKHMHFKLPHIHCPYLLFPQVSVHHVSRHLDHGWCTCSHTLVRQGSDSVSNKRILFRPFSTWRSLTNVTEVPGDWSDQRRNFSPGPLLIILSTGSARPTSPLQWLLRQTQAREKEKETVRDTKRVLAGEKEGVVRQTRSESGRQISSYMDRRPNQWKCTWYVKSGIDSLWVDCMCWVKPWQNVCMISVTRDTGCEARLAEHFWHHP